MIPPFRRSARQAMLLLATSLVAGCSNTAPTSISVAAVEAAYDRNAEAAARDFSSGVSVHGTVESHALGDDGRVSLMLKSNGILSVPAGILDGSQATARAAKPGSAVELSCDRIERIFMKVSLVDCSVRLI